MVKSISYGLVSNKAKRYLYSEVKVSRELAVEPLTSNNMYVRGITDTGSAAKEVGKAVTANISIDKSITKMIFNLTIVIILSSL